MLDIIIIALRAIQFLFAIIVLGLTGHIASYGGSPSQVSFMIFVSVWTVLALIYLTFTPKFVPSIAHVFAIMALDALTMLFWFAGFIALAVFRHDISDTGVEINYSDIFSACSLLSNICPTMEAAVVFGALEWALFVSTTVLAALEAFSNRSRSKSSAGPGV